MSEDIEGQPAALLVLSGENEGTIFNLDKIQMNGGRSKENEIYLPDQRLSRHHFQIAHNGTSYYIRDADSTNGTYLNKRKLEGDSVLINGDIIRVGKTRLKFISGRDPDRNRLDESFEELEIDELTGCYTKSYLNIELNRAVTEAVTKDTPLCLLIFAIDAYEKIGRDSGEEIANYLLMESIKRVKEQGIRSNDILARYSDDEFILMLEGAPLKRAEEIAQRLLELFDDKPIPYRDDHLSTSLSIGLADMRPGMQSGIELFKHTDYALYESRKCDGNSITVYGTGISDNSMSL